jgi:hypothetical protein
MSNVIPIFVSLLSGGIGGSITGATIAHFWTKRRDNANRRASFLGFLNAWEKQVDFDRTIVVVIPEMPGAVVIKTIGKIARDFMEKRIELTEKARGVEPNYRGKKLSRFQALAATVVGMDLGQIDGDPTTLLRALRDLAEFVESQ